MAGNTSFSSGFAATAGVGEKRRERDARRQERLHNRVKEWGETLYNAMMIDDEAVKNTTIDAINAEYEQLAGKPMGKPFVNWLKKSPEDAMSVLENAARSGVSPMAFFELADNPLMLSQGLIAMNKAKMARGARPLRGSGEPTSATPSLVEGPEQLGGPGMGEEGAKPASAAMPSIGETPGTATAGVLANKQVEIRQNIARLRTQINGLARLDRPEPEIKPLRDQLTELTKQLTELETGPAMAGEKKSAELAVSPISKEEYDSAVQTLADRGRRDLANRLRVGMNRQSFDAVMSQAGGGQAAAPQRSGEGFAPAQVEQPGAAPKTGDVMTPAEQKARDIRTKEQIEGAERVASKQYEEYVKAGEFARQKDNAYMTLRDSLRRAGPTGAFVGPLRQIFFNVAQALGANPAALDHIQTAEAASLWLATQILRDFSGPDSDNDFLRAYAQNPSIRKTPAANDLLIALAMQENYRQRLRAAGANKWVGLYQSLLGKDETGRTFNEAWDAHAEKNAPYLTIGMLQKAGINPNKVWKAKRNAPGSEGP